MCSRVQRTIFLTSKTFSIVYESHLFSDSRLDFVLLIGNCGNNSKEYFPRRLDFARNLMHSLTVNPRSVRTALISVSNGAEIVQGLKAQPYNPVAVSSASHLSGGLCTFGQGMEIALALFRNSGIRGIPQVLITLLDGKSDDDVSKPAIEISKAGVLMYAVGSKNKVSEFVASNITSDPTKEFFIPDPGILPIETMKQAVVDKLERGLINGAFYFQPPNLINIPEFLPILNS